MKIERGVMLVKDGMGWGVVYEDGRSTSYGWMPIESAPIHDPQFCKKPSDVTYSGDHNLPEIRKGKLIHVIRRTTVELHRPMEVGE